MTSLSNGLVGFDTPRLEELGGRGGGSFEVLGRRGGDCPDNESLRKKDVFFGGCVEGEVRDMVLARYWVGRYWVAATAKEGNDYNGQGETHKGCYEGDCHEQTRYHRGRV
jgi:hypothetical protein